MGRVRQDWIAQEKESGSGVVSALFLSLYFGCFSPSLFPLKWSFNSLEK